MSGRLLIASAFTLLFTGPAFADCNQAIQDVKEMVTEAETGAGSGGSALPATPHQEQVLTGKQQGEPGVADQTASGQADMPASPHQQQVLAGGQTGQQLSDLVAEASEMAEAGNEEGCMQKVTQAKSSLVSTERSRKGLSSGSGARSREASTPIIAPQRL